MIVKSLSRRGGSQQLFEYLFRYMLNKEKSGKIPDRLQPYVHLAQKHPNVQSFEKELREQCVLQYHGTDFDFAGTPNTHSSNYGEFGNGFYLSNTKAEAKKYSELGIVKQFLVDPSAKLFDAGKKDREYLRQWNEILDRPRQFVPLTEIHDKIREHLEAQGYAGVKAAKQTMIYDAQSLTELPKDFFRQATLSKERTTQQNAGLTQSQVVIRHNVHSRSISGYVKEFQRNEDLRIHKRKDNVQIHHTILSFSNKDKAHVTEEVLRDMAQKFIELRGKDNLYVIVSHHDHDHVHLHCSISGTKINGLSSRISSAEFAKLKIELDRYQQQKYPQLVHSLPRHGRSKKIQYIEVEKNIKRNERASDKTSLMQVLETTFSKSTSRDQFFTELTSQGHVPYYRAGSFAGILFDGHRKFRINRLSYDEKKLSELDTREKEEKQLTELQELRSGKYMIHDRLNEVLETSEEQHESKTDPIQNQLFELQELRSGTSTHEKSNDDNERSVDSERQEDRNEPEPEETDEPDDDDSNEIEDDGDNDDSDPA